MRLVLLALMSGSVLSCVSLSDNESRVGQALDYFCKIEGSAIGHEGFILRLGERAVRFHDWVEKPGSNNEYIGFSVSLSGMSSASYIVKAATVRYAASGTTWLHPDGPGANAISNVDFCEVCEDGSCGGGDGGGGGDGSDGGGGGGGGDGGGGGGDGGSECDCDPNGENCSGPDDETDDDGPLL